MLSELNHLTEPKWNIIPWFPILIPNHHSHRGQARSWNCLRMLILLHANIHILLNHMDAYCIPLKTNKAKTPSPKCNFNFSFSHGSQHQENVHLSNTKLLKASARSRIVQQNLGVCWPTSRTRGCQWQSLLFHLCLALLLLRRGAWKRKMRGDGFKAPKLKKNTS